MRGSSSVSHAGQGQVQDCTLCPLDPGCLHYPFQMQTLWSSRAGSLAWWVRSHMTKFSGRGRGLQRDLLPQTLESLNYALSYCGTPHHNHENPSMDITTHR